MVTIFAGVPGQTNWMPVPQAPIGCPPGLEYLTAVDQLLIQQQVELLEGNLKSVRMFISVATYFSMCHHELKSVGSIKKLKQRGQL